MKRVVVTIMILLITALSFFCVYELIANSTSFQIDYSELHVIYDYTSREDKVPQHISNLMTLTRNVDLNGLPFDLSGNYYREEFSLSTNGMEKITDSLDTDYMWKRYDSEGNNDIIIFFFDPNNCVINFARESNYSSYHFQFDNGKLVFRDESYVSSSYSCVFKYPLSEESKQNRMDIYSAMISIFSPSEDDSSDYIIKSNTQETKTRTWIEDFIHNTIIPWAWGIFAGGFISVFLLFIAFNRTSRLLKTRYKKNLREALFPEEHSWFGNNSPNNIYVSVRVYLKEEFSEYNLLQHFASILQKKKSTFSVILGNAGEGKTFSLSRIALGILDGFNFSKKNDKVIYKRIHSLIPVILNFTELSHSGNDDDIMNCIYEKIYDVAKYNHRSIKIMRSRRLKVIDRFLSHGKFVIMIDGYDEIANTKTRLVFSTILMHFMDKYNKCGFILTSRTQIYDDERYSNILQHNTLYLSPLSKEQVREFLGKWNFPKNKSGTMLYQRIVNTVQLESVVVNPLLLTMIAHTYSKSEFTFSESKLNLYQQCCQCLLNNWEIKKRVLKRVFRYRTLENTDLKMELLALFAYHLFEKNRSSEKESTLLTLWSNHSSEAIYFHGKAKDVLYDIINQSGLLEKTDANNIRFRHRSFYEYFVALHMSAHSVDISRLQNNVQNEQNILFFYLSLIEDELVVTEFMINNLKYIKLLQDIIIECKIVNTRIICEVVNHILGSTNYEDITQLQAIGYIAQKYSDVALSIRDVLSDKLSVCENKQIKVNILVGLMIFCDRSYLHDLFNLHFDSINLNLVVQYSGDVIDNFATVIIGFIEDEAEKLWFIELLARTYRFEAVYNIYLLGTKIDKDLAIIGLLYMTREPALLDWLSSKKFYENGRVESRTASHKLLVKYGWIEEELSDSVLGNLFFLLYLVKEIIMKGFKINCSLINNNIAFLLSYIICDESKSLAYKLIDIHDFKVKSIAEYSYHWNRRKRNKRRGIFVSNGYMSISILNRFINFSALTLIFSQMIIYLFTSIRVHEIFEKGWDIRVDFMNDFSLLPFNMSYLCFLIGCFIVIRTVNFLLRKTDYNTYSVLLSIITALLFSYFYMLIVQNIVFRIISIAITFVVYYLEIKKHRNDYPSLKEPQYSRILEYLA